MSHYQFSKHSYDKLKQFLDVVDNNLHVNDNNVEETKIFQKLFPQDNELINKLRQSVNSRLEKSEVIEIEDDVDRQLEDKLETMEIDVIKDDIDNPIFTDGESNENLGETLKNVVLLLKEVLLINEYDNAMKIIEEWGQEQYLKHIFEQIKHDISCLSLWKYVLNCNNFIIVQVYCDVILSKYILSNNEEIPLILKEMIKKYPQIVEGTLVGYLLVNNEQNMNNEFIESLSLLSDEYKNRILWQFINQSSHLNASQLKIISKLMHSRMDLLTMKSLLHILSNNKHLASDRNFGHLLESLVSKANKNLFVLREQLKGVISLIPGMLRSKLMQMVNALEQQGDSFSQTML